MLYGVQANPYLSKARYNGESKLSMESSVICTQWMKYASVGACMFESLSTVMLKWL